MSSARIIVALILAALPVAASPAVFGEKPKLVLKAPRLQMLKPGLAAQGFGKRVDVRARLEGDPDDPETYYCLDEIWDWGDGTESVSEPDCDPFEEGTDLKMNFMDTHYFGPAGGSSLWRSWRTTMSSSRDVSRSASFSSRCCW